MNNVDNVIATITEKVLDKPLLTLPNFKLGVSDLIGVAIIFGIALVVYWVFRMFMHFQVGRNKLRKSQSRTLIQLSGYVITLLAITYAFSYVGYSLTYLFVGSTALLVGLGFGLQQLFVDLISGIILLIDKNINYGDVVKVDLGGSQKMEGKIINIGLRTTILETIDNEMVIIPNSKMLQTGLKSFMKSGGSVRFRIQVQVAYNSDMKIVKQAIFTAVKNNPKIDKDPEPTLIIRDFNDSGILVEVRFWMKEIFNYESILSETRFMILDEFRKNAITIPFPQRVIHQAN